MNGKTDTSKIAPAKSENNNLNEDLGIDKMTGYDKSLESIISEKDRLVKRLEQLEFMMDTRFQEKEIYEYFKTTFASWEEEFQKVPRHGQGVPNARKVRELCCNIRVAMGPNGEFSRNSNEMLETGVAGFEGCSERIEKFRKLLEEKSPSPVTVEKIRRSIGELVGSVDAILECLYGGEEN